MKSLAAVALLLAVGTPGAATSACPETFFHAPAQGETIVSLLDGGRVEWILHVCSIDSFSVTWLDPGGDPLAVSGPFLVVPACAHGDIFNHTRFEAPHAGDATVRVEALTCAGGAAADEVDVTLVVLPVG